jgi:hypothetical protein
LEQENGMRKIFFVAVAASMPLAACDRAADPTNGSGNEVVVPADQAERELMANGFSGERSSGESATGDSRIGTNGQTNVSGAAREGAAGSQSKQPPNNSNGAR